MPEIIGIDNGNYNTKTLNTTITSGVVEYETDPFIPNGKIKYKGKYFVCGGETGNLMKDLPTITVNLEAQNKLYSKRKMLFSNH